MNKIQALLQKLGLVGEKKPATIEAELHAVAAAFEAEQSTHESTKAALAAESAKLPVAEAKIVDLCEKLTAAEAKVVESAKAIADAEKKIAEKVEVKAAAIAAAVGVEPANLEKENNSAASVFEKLQSMKPGKDRLKFAVDNWQKIRSSN